MGDRVAMIEDACRHMDSRGIKVLRTSGLWETEAMYVKEQSSFINGVCEVETSLGPFELLDELQKIETSMGRMKIIDKGPRNIDLDILLYGDKVVDDPRLSIPHRLLLERPFVLHPLCELIPNASLPHPHSAIPFRTHLANLPTPSAPLSTLTPLSPTHPPLTPLTPTRRTQLMAILNLTPDSFSDGGLHTPTNLTHTISTLLTSGATILDLGGQSTRPGAAPINPQEELSRILPAIPLIRSLPHGNQAIISIDTHRASVAHAAIRAGADMINDVSGGTLDPEMLPTVAKLRCTICLMHMRGTPQTMTSQTSYPRGLLPTLAADLLARVRAAEEAGVRRWRMVLDPGIGFAKDGEQNLEILRRLGELREMEGLKGLPWLVGVSRKGFIGKITGVGVPRERGWGTAACVSAAVCGGADVVRVHDFGEMRSIVRMGDAIWRV
ncbi:MAG: trifunctional dihydropteroate synthetase [Candelina submexicana]|nr:MAG: trifunctional dihydropteroate synthetase [Candelina submexicana]